MPAALRVAFLGPAATTGAHALHAPAGGLEPRFIEARPGADPRGALNDFAPHVVIALAPQLLPPGALDGLRAARLAVHTGAAAGYDRVLGAPGVAGAWRTRPLPVDDRLYADVRPSNRPPRALFVGRSTVYREEVLTLAKHSHDVLHYSHGLAGAALADALAATDVGIAVTAERGGGFPAQALVHLAAGQLLLSERLTPLCGLEPGIDFLEFEADRGLNNLLVQLRLRPDAYERVRIRGRLKAEQHRASRVWPRIVGDLLQDLRSFGANTLQA